MKEKIISKTEEGFTQKSEEVLLKRQKNHYYKDGREVYSKDLRWIIAKKKERFIQKTKEVLLQRLKNNFIKNMR